RSDQYDAWTGICVYQIRPPVVAMNPAAITALTPTFVTRAWASPAQRITVPAVAMKVSPVFSADQPSTCCTYSVRRKKFANVTAPSSRLATFAPATVRTRKMRSGMSGYRAQDSITTKMASNAAATARRESVQPDAHPWSGAFDTA